MVTGIGAISSASSSTTTNGIMASSGSQGPQLPLKEPAPKSDRRSNKPIMEKRRRARINNCLNELKTLILDATKKDAARHSKLEKADILEKTVKHLQELQRQQAIMSQAVDPKVVNKFKAGFTECANEVSRFPGLEPNVKRRLLQHLSNCINGIKSETAQQHHQPQPNRNQLASHQKLPQQIHSIQVNMLPSPPSSPEQDQHPHHISQHHQHHLHHQHPAVAAGQIQSTVNGYFLPNGVQVIPTKLPNGNIALVLPQSVPQATQLPMLVPIPSRTSSTGSASSTPHSNYERGVSRDNTISPPIMYAPPSPANSYEAMDCQTSVIHHSSSVTAINSGASASVPMRSSSTGSHSSHFYSHHPSYSNDAAPLSLVMKKDKEEDQPWRPW